MTRSPYGLSRLAALALLLGVAARATPGRADFTARVRQGTTEWTMAPLLNTVQVAPWYSYGRPVASSANTGLETTGTSLLFLYDDPLVVGPSPPALALAMIHDAPGNPAGGSASFDITGLPAGAQYAVRDDPGDAYAPNPPAAGSTRLDWAWGAADTDGAAIDGIGAWPFCLHVVPTFTAGITQWQTLDGPDLTNPGRFTIPSLAETVHVCVNCLTLASSVPPSTACAGGTAFVTVRATGASLCGTSSITNDRTTGGADASDTYPLGRTDVTFTLSDGVGFVATRTVTVEVTESPTPPAVTNCPAPLVLACAGTADVPSADARVQAWLAEFTATDDCVGTALTNDAPASFPAGCHGSTTPVVFTVTDSSGNVATCDSSVTVRVECIGAPADVGAALRVTGHGDPLASRITATFDWSRDEGLPRRTDEHYHVLRGTTPTSLAPVPGAEPWTALTFEDSTPAAASLPFVHYYSVLAAGPCEDPSAD